IPEIQQKIADYEKNGVILAYQAVVDPEKLDVDAVTAYIEVRITPERGGGFDRLAQRIARFDEVKSCWLMSGGYDLAVIVEGGNLRQIAHFVSEKLSTVEGVIATATRFRLKTYKQNGYCLVNRLPLNDCLLPHESSSGFFQIHRGSCFGHPEVRYQGLFRGGPIDDRCHFARNRRTGLRYSLANSRGGDLCDGEG
ncbi:MAG TPA: Lrp/AsnC family transcriptional regulator, partial [Chthoniobacterales bacterium]|nr:Lrp/AsnC family transcriptional regulator [Chthoniobacterales bacterium]